MVLSATVKASVAITETGVWRKNRGRIAPLINTVEIDAG